MKKIHATGLYVSIWAALTLAAVARASTLGGIEGAVLGALFWAVVQGAGLIYAAANDTPPPKQVTDGIAAFGLLMAVAEMLLGGMVSAAMSMLLWVQASRNPALATRRDAFFALAISLTLVIFSAAESRSSAFLALMVGYGFALLAVLVYCHQQAGFDREAPTPEPAPASKKRAAAPRKLLPLRHVAALSGAVFAFALGWYLLVPRPDPINYGVVATQGGQEYSRDDWKREARGGKAGPSGSSGQQSPARNPGRYPSEVDVDHSNPGKSPSAPRNTLQVTHPDNGGSGKGGRKRAGNGIVMYVQADRPLYLRSRTYDLFEQDRWHNTRTASRKLLPEQGSFQLPIAGKGAEVRYVVQVVAPLESSVPLSAHAVSLKAPAGVVAQTRDGVVFVPNRIQPGFQYSAVSLLPDDEARPVSYDALPDREPYLQLPEDFSPRITELARRASAAAATPYDKALALESHLRTTYAYSFETVFTSQNVTPLESFLFETRRGHCEFFASAMAAMLRSIGIPSRMVHGFLAHNFNPVTGFYEVQNFDGHAWVEAWIEGKGWTTFEPTAAYPMPQRQGQTGTTLVDLKSYAEQLAKLEQMEQGEQGLLASLSALLSRLVEMWHLLILTLTVWLSALRAWFLANLVLLIALLGAGTALGVLAWRMRARLWWLWAQFAVRSASLERLPLIALRHLERVARARKLGRHASETVDEYTKRLQSAHAELERELRLLRRGFNATRYGGRQLGPQDRALFLESFFRIGKTLSESPPAHAVT